MSVSVKVTETCGCGAHFSADDGYHHGNFVWEKLEEWRKNHPCKLREQYERER